MWRQDVCRKNQPIKSATKKPKTGLSAMAAFTANHDCVASRARPAIAERISGDGHGGVWMPILRRPVLVPGWVVREQFAELGYTREAAARAGSLRVGSLSRSRITSGRGDKAR